MPRKYHSVARYSEQDCKHSEQPLRTRTDAHTRARQWLNFLDPTERIGRAPLLDRKQPLAQDPRALVNDSRPVLLAVGIAKQADWTDNRGGTAGKQLAALATG